MLLVGQQDPDGLYDFLQYTPADTRLLLFAIIIGLVSHLPFDNSTSAHGLCYADDSFILDFVDHVGIYDWSIDATDTGWGVVSEYEVVHGDTYFEWMSSMSADSRDCLTVTSVCQTACACKERKYFAIMKHGEVQDTETNLMVLSFVFDPESSSFIP